MKLKNVCNLVYIDKRKWKSLKLAFVIIITSSHEVLYMCTSIYTIQGVRGGGTYLHDHGGVFDVHGELIRVPAKVRGPCVRVNGP